MIGFSWLFAFGAHRRRREHPKPKVKQLHDLSVFRLVDQKSVQNVEPQVLNTFGTASDLHVRIFTLYFFNVCSNLQVPTARSVSNLPETTNLSPPSSSS